MQRRTLLLALGAAAAVASPAGCGQKGPLYLPEEEEEKERDKAREKQSTTGRDARRSPA